MNVLTKTEPDLCIGEPDKFGQLPIFVLGRLIVVNRAQTHAKKIFVKVGAYDKKVL